MCCPGNRIRDRNDYPSGSRPKRVLPANTTCRTFGKSKSPPRNSDFSLCCLASGMHSEFDLYSEIRTHGPGNAMATQLCYLKQNVIVEPLINQWYAWSYLIAPAPAAMLIAN